MSTIDNFDKPTLRHFVIFTNPSFTDPVWLESFMELKDGDRHSYTSFAELKAVIADVERRQQEYAKSLEGK